MTSRLLKIVLTAFATVVTVVTVNAQTAAEIAAAKSMARSYGYSDTEIDAVLNHNIQTGKSNAAAPLNATSPLKTSAAPLQKSSPLQSASTTTTAVGEIDNVMVEAGDGEIIVPLVYTRPESAIYGHDFFTSNGLSVIPSYNAPVPESYVLGPGDEVVVDIWGSTTTSVIATIGKDGSIPIADLGPVYIAGQTVKRAEGTLVAELSRIISDLGGSNPKSNLRLTVGKIKGVTVNVLGEVNTPGMYTLPSLSTITSAIYMAGGLKETGSVREIKLYRNGKQISSFDLYDFIFKGKYDKNLRLQDNDIITVEAAGKIVNISGSVTRGMSYELKNDQTVQDVLDYALGFRYDAVKDALHLERISSGVGLAYDLDESQYASFKVEDGDLITVRTNRGLFENRVSIGGAVMNPGTYAIGGSITTVADLIKAAGGLMENAYREQGQIERLDEQRQRAFMAFDVAGVLAGSDIELVRDDNVRIFSIDELRTDAMVRINGNVRAPGDFLFSEGMTLGDLILRAGGFDDGADKTKIEVASIGYAEKGEVHSYDVLANPQDLNVRLKPYDVVAVRRLTYFRPQSSISLHGEVITPGTYVVDKAEVRLTDVINRAGGFTPEAFVKGAKLTRVLTAEEQENQRVAYETAMKNLGRGDSIDMSVLTDRYTVGIDLEKAMANPGSSADIVLRDGDAISVPQFNNVVRISGGVYVPTATSYDEKYSWRDYVSAAGGFTKQARKRKIYAIYMNGKVASRGHNFKMEPGMEIVVPEKKDVEHRLSATEVAAIASSTSSVAAMVVAIINLMRK